MYDHLDLTDKDIRNQSAWTTQQYRQRLRSISRLSEWDKTMYGIVPSELLLIKAITTSQLQ